MSKDHTSKCYLLLSKCHVIAKLLKFSFYLSSFIPGYKSSIINCMCKDRSIYKRGKCLAMFDQSKIQNTEIQ